MLPYLVVRLGGILQGCNTSSPRGLKSLAVTYNDLVFASARLRALVLFSTRLPMQG